jgi:predicted Zn-dependent protease
MKPHRASILVALVAGRLALLGATACSTNPVTGGWSFTGLMTTAREVGISREEHPQILEAFGGAYDEPALQACVDRVGQSLASRGERTELTYKFTILNSSIANALSTPGGYVYITRGLLPLADNEAELAGVLGHELGHINARHHAQSYSRQVLAQLGFMVLGQLAAAPIVQGTQILAVGYLQAFSREQEYQADLLGVRYLVRTGYDPNAMAGFLQKLRAHSRLEAKLVGMPPDSVDEFDYFSSHPAAIERFKQALEEAHVQAVQKPVVARDIYLDRIDGLLYGTAPSEGIVRDRVFAHPVLRIRFEVPPGFRIFNTPNRVYAVRQRDSLIVFDMAERAVDGSMLNYLTDVWAQQLALSDVQQLNVNGLEAATGRTQVNTNRGFMELRLVAIRVDAQHIYRFRFVTRPGGTQQISGDIGRTIYSFRTLSEREVASLKPLRVRVVRVKSGETERDLAQRMAMDDLKLDRFRVLNGLTGEERLEPGQRVKLVTE